MNAPERVLRKITSDSLATYLAEVRRQSVPTPAEEVALGRRIQAGDAEALRELVERNLRFVVQVANKYKGYGLPLADLINEGNVGLLHAAGKFDPEHGTRFITYAVWWIRQAIMHALAEGGGRCGFPSNRPRRWRGCGRRLRRCDAPRARSRRSRRWRARWRCSLLRSKTCCECIARRSR